MFRQQLIYKVCRYYIQVRIKICVLGSVVSYGPHLTLYKVIPLYRRIWGSRHLQVDRLALRERQRLEDVCAIRLIGLDRAPPSPP